MHFSENVSINLEGKSDISLNEKNDNLRYNQLERNNLNLDDSKIYDDEFDKKLLEFENSDFKIEQEQKADKSKVYDEFEEKLKKVEDVDKKIDKVILPMSEIKTISEVSDWLKDINSNFDEFDLDSPYANNCGSCAYAVFQRLEGNENICATEENIGYSSEMTELTGMQQVSMNPEDIEKYLLAQGNGANAIVGIDRNDGTGHWFNAACLDGKIVAIDGQTSEIFEWPPDYGNVISWDISVKKEGEKNNG